MTEFLRHYENRSAFRASNVTSSVAYGTLLEVSADGKLVLVEVNGGQYWLHATPGMFEVGARVAVDMSGGKPRIVSGGVEANEAAEKVTVLPDLVPAPGISDADKALLDETAAGLADANTALSEATETLETSMAELEEQLGATQSAADQASVDARNAHNDAVTAQQAADDALAKYGPLDDRTTAAQAAAQAAQNRADSAYSLAQSKPGTSEVEAMVAASANGKNSITISTDHPSDYNQGVSSGDVWWVRDYDSHIYAQYTWNGSSWVASTVRNEMIASLDVHKLQVTGSAELNEAVVSKLWSEVVAARLVTAQKLITSEALIDGAVTARTLNVVPEAGQGGMSLQPEGLTVFSGEDGQQPIISLRSDTEQRIGIMNNGAYVASLSPDGGITGQTVAANESLVYRGVEVADLLAALPQGLLAHSETGIANSYKELTYGQWLALTEARFVTPPPGRALKITTRFQFDAGAVGLVVSAHKLSNRSKNGGTMLKFLRGEYSTSGYWAQPREASFVIDSADLPTAPGEEAAIMGWGSVATNGVTARFFDQESWLTVEDVGAYVEPTVRTLSGTPATSGSTTPTVQNPKTITSETFTPAWSASYYLSSGAHNTIAGDQMYHGNFGKASYGVMRSMVGFGTDVRSFIGSGRVTKIEVYLKNIRTYNGSAMNTRMGWHSQGSQPSTYSQTYSYASSMGGVNTTHLPGQGRWVTIPLQIAGELANGTLRGITLDPMTTSTAYYGVFSGSGTRLRITVEK